MTRAKQRVKKATMAPCYVYNATVAEEWGSCCDDFGMTTKPWWYFAALTVPVEIALVTIEVKDAGSVGEAKKGLELAIFAALTLASFALIVGRVLTADGDAECKSAWECYSGVVFLFNNSAAVLTGITASMRVVVKHAFAPLAYLSASLLLWPPRFGSLAEPVDLEGGDFDEVLCAITGDEMSSVRTRPEHIVAGGVVLLSGGLTHVVPGLFIYAPVLVSVTAGLTLSHAARVLLPRWRGLASTWVSLPLLSAACAVALAVGVGLGAMALVGLLAAISLLSLLFLALTFSRALASCARRQPRPVPPAPPLDAASAYDDKEEGDVEEEDTVREVAEEDTVGEVAEEDTVEEVAEEDTGGLRSVASAIFGLASLPFFLIPAAVAGAVVGAVGAGASVGVIGASPAGGVAIGLGPRLNQRRSLEANTLGVEEPTHGIATPALADLVIVEEQFESVQLNAKHCWASALVEIKKEMKKLVFFDAGGNVIMFTGASLALAFSLLSNYLALLFAGVPWTDVPGIDARVRQGDAFYECTRRYSEELGSVDVSSMVGIMELVLVGISAVLLSTVVANQAVQIATATPVPGPAPSASLDLEDVVKPSPEPTPQSVDSAWLRDVPNPQRGAIAGLTALVEFVIFLAELVG